MHLANSAVSPECIALSWVGAATGLSLAVRAIRKTTIDRSQLTEAVLLTSVVFAAQMINVPILSHTSVHLIGGVLLAWWLSPALSIICMTAVLAVQAVLLGDGGLAALGANIISMALIPAAVVAVISRKWDGGKARFMSGWTAMILGALCVPLLTMTSGAEQTFTLITRMLSIHAVAGIFEGTVTAAGLKARSYLRFGRSYQLHPVALVCVTAVLLTAVPISSPKPDTYESSAISAGLSSQLPQFAGNIADISTFHAVFERLQKRCAHLSSRIFPNNHALSLVSLITCALLAGSMILFVRKTQLEQSTVAIRQKFPLFPDNH